jgi:hypothetical protein
VRGGPIDQFSFLESGDQLNVLVRSDGAGDGMWSAETTEGDLALLRLPLPGFSAEVSEAPAQLYRALPRPDGRIVQNRFVGDLSCTVRAAVGGHRSAARTTGCSRAATRARGWCGRSRSATASIGSEPLGKDAIVVGLGREGPPLLRGRAGRRAGRRGALRAARCDEGRASKPRVLLQPDGERSGVFGLPIRGGGKPGYSTCFEDSAAVVFVRNDALRLEEIGSWRAAPRTTTTLRTTAAPLASIGTATPGAIPEPADLRAARLRARRGRLADGRIEERRRVSFAPTAQQRQ